MTIRREYVHSCDPERLYEIAMKEVEPYISKFNVKITRVSENIFEAKVSIFGKGTIEIQNDRIIITVDSSFLGMPGMKEKVEEMMDKYMNELIEKCKAQS
ncbi:hypothetical protein SAMN04488510_1167 [Fervidobacterium changbaicum]|uniref:Uncharacterized protein n=2 Tax=Fervidobacterium TaxID=2422 RepID=A0AAI8CK72_FERIS|nr:MULTISPECIES: hypothetical protein [Fervidobacterium]AMW32905.1 hypothetical protein NA23_06290 [Fervidobacterium islandicum]QAV32944.1 hypothetical protein CBS1_03810 [Fervidobacterium changbaicum]SDH47346.1 hypothetical protein SAMN04488510_1167 [Fervidobacterium changbaicum]